MFSLEAFPGNDKHPPGSLRTSKPENAQKMASSQRGETGEPHSGKQQQQLIFIQHAATTNKTLKCMVWAMVRITSIHYQGCIENSIQ